MAYTPETKLADLSVGDFENLLQKMILKVVKWALFLSVGLPLILFGLLGLFGFIMYTLAGSA